MLIQFSDTIVWGEGGSGEGGKGGKGGNVPVNLTICEDLLKVPKTLNRYLSGFPGDARHRAKT